MQTAVSSFHTPISTGTSAYQAPDGSYTPRRPIFLSPETLIQVHVMMLSAVFRARLQLAEAAARAERELLEEDLADCIAALDEFNQAARGC